MAVVVLPLHWRRVCSSVKKSARFSHLHLHARLSAAEPEIDSSFRLLTLELLGSIGLRQCCA